LHIFGGAAVEQWRLWRTDHVWASAAPARYEIGRPLYPSQSQRDRVVDSHFGNIGRSLRQEYPAPPALRAAWGGHVPCRSDRGRRPVGSCASSASTGVMSCHDHGRQLQPWREGN
jgi:hypothetical protein